MDLEFFSQPMAISLRERGKKRHNFQFICLKEPKGNDRRKGKLKKKKTLTKLDENLKSRTKSAQVEYL